LTRQLFILTAFLSLVVLFAHGQKPQANKSNFNQQKFIDSLKNSVDQKWIRINPTFIKTKSSFFNTDNENKYFVGLLQISGQSIPFTWDDNLSLLQFLLTLDNEINFKRGIAADEKFKGTRIVWEKKLNGLIWFNDKTYKALVDNWYLSTISECPGTIIFPNLSLKKVTEIPTALTNNLQGLTILPYNKNIIIKSSKTTMTTEDGKAINGVGYDLDNDDIFDIFNFNEDIDETTNYIRLYINVNGHWKCKWVNLDEACL